MTAARKRRMKTSGAIRTTFGSVPTSAGSARKREDAWLALPRSYLVQDGNDHPRLRNGENGGLFACHDPAAERRVLAAGALASRSRPRPATRRFASKTLLLANCRLTIRVTSTNLRAIQHFAAPFCERSDVIRIRESFELTYDK